ncbi:hypothetical protein OKJ48_43265 [Streptomyces kunmingensis]|uniref:Uncharacterized protein n=1 Tax=Streptomyces kunmingensis TaxID=68225 RepID=A0ABU6CSU0_9ACTN|nr:hypothetical protein [Streptomyces kunmingensis]MEB3967010.1 hypothetical protein [Streptomyces kunmingensis]
MGCCIFAAMAAIGPRVALVLTWLFTTLVDRAFTGVLLPLLGLILLPWTTLGFVFAYAPVAGVHGVGWLVVLIGLLLDLSSYGGGARSRR